MRIGPFTFASDFFNSKTTWTVFGGVGFLVYSGATGQLPWSQVIPAIIAALGGLFHNDTVRKGTEAEAVHRATVLGLAVNPRPKVDLEEVLSAHSKTLKNSVANAVAATVAATIAQLIAQNSQGAESEPRKPVVMAEETANTGVDSGSSAANTAHLMDEPEDGEADA